MLTNVYVILDEGIPIVLMTQLVPSIPDMRWAVKNGETFPPVFIIVSADFQLRMAIPNFISGWIAGHLNLLHLRRLFHFSRIRVLIMNGLMIICPINDRDKIINLY